MLSKRKSMNGFTLLELMTTVVVIGISAAMIAPGFERSMQRIDFKSQSKDVISLFRMARSEAIATKAPFGIYISNSDKTINLFREQSSPLNEIFDAGVDSVYQSILLDSVNGYLYSDLSNSVIHFRPNGSATSSGNIYLGYDDGNVMCYSGLSVLASTGRSKLEYLCNY